MYWSAIGPNHIKFSNTALFLDRYIYKNEEDSMAYNQIRIKYIEKLWTNLIIVYSMIILSYNGIVFGSIYAYFHDGIRLTPLGIHLPYFERDSNCEFIFSMTLQGIIAVLALVGTYICELVICKVNSTFSMIPDLIRFNLTEFFDEFTINGMNLKSTVRIRNVFLQIQDFNEFVTNMKHSSLFRSF